MKIQNSANNRYRPSFKQIRPEHLFINSKGYLKSNQWAENSIQIIDVAKSKIKNKEPFDNIFNFIIDGYKNFYKNESSRFGLVRTNKAITIIEKQYDAYKKKLAKLALNTGKIVEYGVDENSMTNFKAYSHTMYHQNIPLNQTYLKLTDNPFFDEQEARLEIISPSSTSIKPILDIVKESYNKILKTPQNGKSINDIVKEVGKIHWLISQVRPFYRGSAGIADITAKSIFEAKGIQVTPFKKQVNPNMEAFVQNLDEFMENYQNFYSGKFKLLQSEVEKSKLHATKIQ